MFGDINSFLMSGSGIQITKWFKEEFGKFNPINSLSLQQFLYMKRIKQNIMQKTFGGVTEFLQFSVMFEQAILHLLS